MDCYSPLELQGKPVEKYISLVAFNVLQEKYEKMEKKLNAAKGIIDIMRKRKLWDRIRNKDNEKLLKLIL